MYRPPQNSNRVKLIRKKFENVENNKSPERKNVNSRDRGYLTSADLIKKSSAGEEINQNGKHGLHRQTSDPSRRNIKRTPAFRVDRSVDRTNVSQRNGFNSDPSTLYETKIKQFSAVKNNCDNNSNFLSKKSENEPLLSHRKNVPLLSKSNTSLDFNYIKSKFDNNLANSNGVCNDCHDSTNSSKLDKPFDLSLLYTEPIPKALRRNNSTCTDSSFSPSPVSSEKVESSFPNSPVSINKFDSIYNSSTLKISDKVNNKIEKVGLTDTLKLALSKPLPKGPAPKKPPRAFQIEKDDIFLPDKVLEKKPLIHPKSKSPLSRSDPKYMLTKLEDALRNNKLRARKPAKTDLLINSGEDSDDSVLTRTKSNRTLPRLPSQESDSDYNTSAFNFNCLNGFKFALTNYEKIKEPNSCFFVGSPKEEPVYAEPFHYRKDSLDSAAIRREGSSRSKQSARNSLYYMVSFNFYSNIFKYLISVSQ